MDEPGEFWIGLLEAVPPLVVAGVSLVSLAWLSPLSRHWRLARLEARVAAAESICRELPKGHPKEDHARKVADAVLDRYLEASTKSPPLRSWWEMGLLTVSLVLQLGAALSLVWIYLESDPSVDDLQQRYGVFGIGIVLLLVAVLIERRPRKSRS